MIEFLTTPGINYYLDKLLKAANEKLIIISPFMDVPEHIKSILAEKKEQGVAIILICRKKDLKQSPALYATRIIDMPTVHAKCYLSEKEAIITSMNLYEYSQINNVEMGLYVSNSGDGSSLYNDILVEANRLSKAPSTSAEDFDHGSESKLKSDLGSDLKIGKKYSSDQLQVVFNFPYKKPAGIKDTSSGDIVLFSNTGPTPYEDKENEQVTYYQGQNTGSGSQKLIFGNKLLYESYKNPNVKIYFFKNRTYCGEFEIIQKPYMENGTWIFPISRKIK